MTIQRIARPVWGEGEREGVGVATHLLFSFLSFFTHQSAGDFPFEFLPYQLDGRIEAYHGDNG